jgi:hypothetical protein
MSDMSELVDKPQEPPREETDAQMSAGSDHQTGPSQGPREDLLPDVEQLPTADGQVAPIETPGNPAAMEGDTADADELGEREEKQAGIADRASVAGKTVAEGLISVETKVPGSGGVVVNGALWMWQGRELILPEIKEKIKEAGQKIGEAGQAVGESFGEMGKALSPERGVEREIDAQPARIKGEAEQHTYKL